MIYIKKTKQNKIKQNKKKEYAIYKTANCVIPINN